MNNSNEPWGNTVLVEFEGPIAWVYFNRPDKRNSMSPTLNREMFATLRALEIDDRCQLVVLTGTGEAWSAGMDLKEYFRETDNASDAVKSRTRRETADWQWRTLRDYLKPTIAMVNGWCFGGAFTPLVACDLAVAADDATFGLSEVNWGILPAGMVTKVVADTMGYRRGLYYVMTGETFDGRQAAEFGLVNEAVPKGLLKSRVMEIADSLLKKDPIVLRNAKELYKRIGNLDWDTANDYIYAKADASQQQSGGRFRKGALKAFLDDKMLKPGLQTFEEDDKDQAV
jgi:trans-feruloyl-CoA hydratase/vanillin synthase